MSFGIGIGDFIAVGKLIQTVVDACKSGPEEYREAARELETLQATLESVQNDIEDPKSLLRRKGNDRSQELKSMLDNCKLVLDEMEKIIACHSSLKEDGRGGFTRVWDAYQVASLNVDSIRGKLTFYTSTINLFLHSLEGPALARLERKINMIYARLLTKDLPDPDRSTISVASVDTILSIHDPERESEAWSFMKDELAAEGLSASQLEDFKTEIMEYIKRLVPDATSQESDEKEESRLQETRLLPPLRDGLDPGPFQVKPTASDEEHEALAKVMKSFSNLQSYRRFSSKKTPEYIQSLGALIHVFTVDFRGLHQIQYRKGYLTDLEVALHRLLIDVHTQIAEDFEPKVRSLRPPLVSIPRYLIR